MAQVSAPFSEDQVLSLNEFQQSNFVHPFTCGSGHRTDEAHGEERGRLLATTAGWVCPPCGYTQDWAHDWMANWDWKVLVPKEREV